jgi:DNA-binding transcriptional LysR family regulator
MDRFDSVQAFVRVVEAGSFAAAARQLGLTTSAVSKRVTQLEAFLGVRLLQRTTRYVHVTDLGSLFYERAVEIVTLLDDAIGTLQHGQATPAGLLRLSSPTSFGMLHVAPALCDFHARYPALKVEIILNDRVVNPVEEGFDVCLQDAGPRPNSMVERRLFPLRRVVCAAPQYLATHGTPRQPHEVSQHACIQYSYLESGGVWRFDSPSGPIAVPIDPILRTNNGRIMLDAAVQGKGIAVLPTFLAAPDLQRGALVVLLPDFPFPALTLSAVYPRRQHVPARVKLLLDFFIARFGSEPPWDRELAPLFALPPGVLPNSTRG